MKKRHRYDRTTTSSHLDTSVVQCICGVIRECVKGKKHYFINDSVYLKAPKCDPDKYVNNAILSTP